MMDEHVLSKIFRVLNDRIAETLLSGHVFIGTNWEEISRRISDFYNRGSIEPSIDLSQTSDGEEKTIKITVTVSQETRGVRKRIRLWEIKDKEKISGEEKIQQLIGYIAFVDPEELYTSWEKQSDLAIRETVEMAILAYNRKREILKHGTKAAATGIMARNWSHNIGSHVITYWAGETLSNTSKTLWKNYEDIKKTRFFSSNVERLIKKAGKVTDDSKKLFQYIQGRMDFLAEITTSVPSSELSMDFKEELLKPMLDTSRQRGNEPIGVPPLLEFIASSEGLQLQNNNITIATLTTRSRVSIPNGIIGAHAVYTTVENFIRNAAKHYKGNADPKDEIFSLELRDPEDPEWEKDFFELRLKDLRKNSCNEHVLKKILPFLSTEDESGELVDGTNKLRPGGWGFKEMRICANFLRKRTSEELFEIMVDGQPPLIALLCDGRLFHAEKDLISLTLPCSGHSDCSTFSNQHSQLTLCLYLLKPKHLLIKNCRSPEMITKADNLFQIDIGLKDYQKGTMSKTEKPHRIFLTDDEEILAQAARDTKLPCRIKKLDAFPSVVTDDFYLSTYRSFIMENVCSNGFDLPYILFTGGGKESLYKALFENNAGDLSEYGRSIDPRKISDEFLNSADNRSLAVFYHHAEDEDKDSLEPFDRNPKVIYFQPMSAKYSFSNKAKYAPQANKMREQFLLELVESILTYVIVVDERISKLAEQTWGNHKENQKTVGEILCKMGIFIIPVNRKSVSLNDLSESLSSIPSFSSANGRNTNIFNRIEMMNVFESACLENAFFVIHQGILDKLEKTGVDIEEFFNRVRCKWKIIVSGRGVPQDLLRNARFVEISAILKMIESFDKHGLVQILFASRNPKIYLEDG